ncbi:hypothetical protein CDAR_423651 [Caerostris darwini]|uniref:Uncharacterized protein n=1 Tax=Caerostris darwini TaxID=1538125 RepID=A0AAV4VAX3_9ARAC|nr:hypothetical protein CDAR_423651 [Caerostris darwini]
MESSKPSLELPEGKKIPAAPMFFFSGAASPRTKDMQMPEIFHERGCSNESSDFTAAVAKRVSNWKGLYLITAFVCLGTTEAPIKVTLKKVVRGCIKRYYCDSPIDQWKLFNCSGVRVNGGISGSFRMDVNGRDNRFRSRMDCVNHSCGDERGLIRTSLFMEDLRHLHIFGSGGSRVRKEEHQSSRNFLSFWKFQRRFRRLRGTFQKGKLASPMQRYWGNFWRTWAIVVPHIFQPSLRHIKGRRQRREAVGAKFNLGSLPQIVEEQRNTFRSSAPGDLQTRTCSNKASPTIGIRINAR